MHFVCMLPAQGSSVADGTTLQADERPRLIALVMHTLELPLVGRWFVASLATFLAFIVQLELGTPGVAPFVLFFVAVVVTTWVGGRGPGLLSVILSAAVANYGLFEPRGEFATSGPAITATGLFVVSASVVVLLCTSFRATVLRSDSIAAALQESEARFRQLANAMPQLVWTADPGGRLDYCNDRFTEFVGLEPRGPAAWSWEECIHPDDRAVTVAAWTAAVRAGAPYEISHRVHHKDRGYRWLLSRAVPARNAAGRIVKWYGTATDIDAQKRAEDALRKTDQLKNEFLAVLSHELRNPLAPIRNSAYVLGLAKPGSAQAERARQVIERQVTHLARLIDDLLDVTRIARGKIRLQCERLDLADIVNKAAEDHRASFVSGGIELEVRSSTEPVVVSGDATRLTQIVGNLLGNAAKFTSRGGRVTLALESEGTSALIRVRDDGAGIPPEVLGRLFEPFTQADETLDRSKGGLGLGLALVKGLVELHGGGVEARSAGVGMGAEFTVRLPIAEEQESLGRPTSAPVVRPRKRRVLLIEDNSDAACSLKEVLELGGHEVEVATSGPEGIAKAHEFHPDVAICDIGLPGIDGYELARRVRADPKLREIELFALSGYASPADVERSRAAGYTMHFAKPPDLGAIEVALGRST